MRQYGSVMLVVTGSLLLGLASCAGDSRTSSSETSSTSQIAQAQEAKDLPPSGEIQERGGPQIPPGTDLPTPPATAGEQGQEAQGEPPVGKVEERGVPRKLPRSATDAPPPSGVAPPPGYVGPTENITKVGRAIQVRAKSLTTLVVVAPGLVLTQPVTISIALGGNCPTRITQTYVSTGNHFLYNDCEGDGKPRRAFADITLTEPKPGGGIYTATIPGSVMLDPLYDVTISPLSFTLFTDCDPVGRSEITLQWISPDNSNKASPFFLTRAGKHVNIDTFAWSRAEVSASANLRMPGIWSFYDEDSKVPLPGGFYHGIPPPPPVSLVPGVTRQVVTSLKEFKGDCEASMQYNITYKLRWYPFL